MLSYVLRGRYPFDWNKPINSLLSGNEIGFRSFTISSNYVCVKGEGKKKEKVKLWFIDVQP